MVSGAHQPLTCRDALRFLAARGSPFTSSGSAALSSAVSFDEKDLLHPVDFLEFHFDNFEVRGLHHAADVLGLDGQLAVAAVDKSEERHAGGAADPAGVKVLLSVEVSTVILSGYER